jgi:hypothetical protein
VGPTSIYNPFFPTSTLCYKSPEPPFFDLFSATRSWYLHLHIHIPWVIICTWPQRGIFLTSCSSMHAHVQFYQIVVIIRCCSRQVFGFHVCRYLFYKIIAPSGICSTLACNYSLYKSIAYPSHTLWNLPLGSLHPALQYLYLCCIWVLSPDSILPHMIFPIHSSPSKLDTHVDFTH